MPNYCDYRMKVKGKKEDCLTFKKKMDDYTEPKHFWRIFNCDIDEESDDYIILVGDCAWSIESCCRATGYSNGFDLFAENTRDLDLELEVWSRENGMLFEEYYLYRSGECLNEGCESISFTPPEYDKDYYKTFNDYLEDYGLDPNTYTEDMFNEYGEYTGEVGGFDNWGEWTI